MPSFPSQVPVAISSFGGKHMHLFLRKNLDRVEEDVLGPPPEQVSSCLR